MGKPQKIKIFLGAYINQSNAQNMICMALAKHLDKSRYEVYTLLIKHGNFKNVRFDGVTTFTCYFPVKFTQYLGFLWGIFKCDVAFLPRGNHFKYQRFLLRLFGRRSFKTVDNIIDQQAMQSALSIFPDLETALENYRFTDRVYSLTQAVRAYNLREHNLVSEPRTLPPPTDLTLFERVTRPIDRVTDVIFMGNDMRRKGVLDFIALSYAFPAMTFHIVGRDTEQLIPAALAERPAPNVQVYGIMNYEGMCNVLAKCQVHILPSRSEGFPMGILIAAAAGLPSITYADYGATEWITPYENGVVCEDVKQMEASLRRLVEDSALLQRNSAGARALAAQFSTQRVTRMYEEVIDEVYAGK